MRKPEGSAMVIFFIEFARSYHYNKGERVPIIGVFLMQSII